MREINCGWPWPEEGAKKASVESNFGAPIFDVLRHLVLPAAGSRGLPYNSMDRDDLLKLLRHHSILRCNGSRLTLAKFSYWMKRPLGGSK